MKYRFNALVCFSAVLALFAVSPANSVHPMRPDFVKAQIAGNMGTYSFGIGRQHFSGRLETTASLGHVPKKFGGVSHTTLSYQIAVCLPVSWERNEYALLPFQTGIGIHYAIGDRFFVTTPSRYPFGYYKPNAVYSTVYCNFGATKRHRRSLVRKSACYVGVSTTSFHMMMALDNENIGLSDIVGMQAGMGFYF